MKMKLQRRLFLSFGPLVLLAVGLSVHAQAPQAEPAQKGGTVRICDDSGCSDRPKNAVSTETVDNGANQEGPDIIKLKEIAQTNPKAAYDLGLRYFRGDGVRQDSYQALVWMRKAAEQGNLQAQKALGAYYLFGLQEMGPDPQEAERWLSVAVSRGDKESEKLLAQAREAKVVAQKDFKEWQARRAARYWGYWRSGYRYYGIWNHYGWYGY